MTPLAFLNTAAAVADPTRFRMLDHLEGRAMPVGQLGEHVGVTSSVATYHVRLLRDAGLVATERRGRSVASGLRGYHFRRDHRGPGTHPFVGGGLRRSADAGAACRGSLGSSGRGARRLTTDGAEKSALCPWTR